MKKLLAAVLITAFTLTNFATTAQTVKLTTKAVTAADTIVFNPAPSKIKAFQYTFTETSGTTAGKVYFEGTINGTYVLLDSLTLSDVSTAQTKVFVITATNYVGYRFRNTNTSSAVGVAKGAYIKRTDE